MVTDSIADYLTRIRNAQRAGHKSCIVDGSKMNVSLSAVLKSEGFIIDYTKVAEATHSTLKIELKYYGDGQPVMQEIKRMSKPGRRSYVRCEEIPQVHNGLGIAILSTSQGIFSDKEARARNIGGELLALIG